MSKLQLRTEGDQHVVITRRFDAPPAMVYRAHTEPELIRKWMLGPPGWTMPVCINDNRVGGKFRCEWTNGAGHSFSITAELLELEPGRRIVHVERMHLPDPTPDNHVETIFQADGTGTLMTIRMTLPDAKTREMMLGTGMEHGMEASYERLERICAGPEPEQAGNRERPGLHGTPEIIHIERKVTATIRMNIPRSEMMKVFGPAMQELMSVLGAQGIAPIGSAFAHHFKMTPGVFDFEIGFVTQTPVKESGRVKPSEWPAQRCAHAIYMGPYEGLPVVWGEFDAWMKSNHLVQSPDLYEQYVTGPHMSADPKQWRTELYRPLVD